MTEADGIALLARGRVGRGGFSHRAFGRPLRATARISPGVPVSPQGPELLILDPTQHRAPTSVQITIANAGILEDYTIAIDGTPVYEVTTDADGILDATSIPVDEGNADFHILTATSDDFSLTAVFTLARDAVANPALPGNDADPVFVPESQDGDRFHWVLQDLAPGGLGSWVMPISPTSMTPPHARKSITVTHTTSPVDGAYLANESHMPPLDWSFAGYCPDVESHYQLAAYAELNRRFYVIDHRGRAWTVAATGVDMKARQRQRRDDGTFEDWAGDYTFTVLLLSQQWKEPQ